jgi:hypothetical protein
MVGHRSFPFRHGNQMNSIPRPNKGKPLLTPYVALRSNEIPMFESELTVEISDAGPRLAYKRRRPGDRDHHGNLWTRLEKIPGDSNVIFHSMHSDRQRECMEKMLCQVCAGPADHNHQGWLFIDWRRENSPSTWPEHAITPTPTPPLCADHARASELLCPYLRQGEYAVLRVRKPHLYGVAGGIYRRTEEGWISSEHDVLSAYSKPRLPGMLAVRLYRELRGVTVV